MCVIVFFFLSDTATRERKNSVRSAIESASVHRIRAGNERLETSVYIAVRFVLGCSGLEDVICCKLDKKPVAQKTMQMFAEG